MSRYSRTGKGSKHVGGKFINNQGIEGVVIDVMTPTDPRRKGVGNNKKSTLLLIEFGSGYSNWYAIENVRNGSFRDYGTPTKYGGYSYPSIENKRVYETWKGMLRRCYDKNSKDYPVYGGRGVIVSDRWKHLKNFERDIKNLEGYQEWVDNPSLYSLDKDSILKGNKVYCFEYCKFADNMEQSHTSSSSVKIRSIDMRGNVEIFPSIAEASRRIGIKAHTIRYFSLEKEGQEIEGYTFKRI